MLERELLAVLESTADAAFAVDEQGLVQSWNRAAEKLFGYPASAVINKPCASIFQGRDAFGTPVCSEHCSILECAAKHRETPNYDMEVNSHSGRSLWINVSILVFHDDRTSRTLVVHLARDISHRKRKEDLARKLVQLAKDITSVSENGGGGTAPVSPLTEQERKVLRLLAAGKSTTKVAQDLKIAPRTLRNHIHHVNQKLHTRNRLEAVMQACRRKLI